MLNAVLHCVLRCIGLRSIEGLRVPTVLTGRVASLLQGPAVVPLVPLVPLQVVSLGGHFTVLLLLLLLRPGPAY